MSAAGETPGKRPSTLGRYELITQIGQGGMAEVQLAIQRGPAGFEKLVVVKLVHANLATQKAFVDMLLDEARVAALVKHPNVVDIYDLGESEGRYFIAMEYLEGEPLLAVLRAGRDGKRLDPMSTARLIADTAEGLDAAHELRSMAGEAIELVHHDVSLGNIVVLYNGQAKLVDFGVAKATMSVATTTRVQGKFSYMAPEKLRGGAGDRRSDIWSLGCVLWEALTLRRLFKGGNDNDTMRQVLESEVLPPSSVNGEVHEDFDAIVMHALDRDPAKRYATAKEMAVDLEEVLRKHGYGGRNDVIARYMQSTFQEHIVARKKLLQEVSSKGRASAAVLEAAFQDSMLASGSPVNSSGEFSVRFKTGTGELTAEGTPQKRSGSQDVTYPRATTADITTFQTQSATPVRAETDVEPVRSPARNRRMDLIAVGIGVVIAAGVIAVLMTRERSEHTPATATPSVTAPPHIDVATPGSDAVAIVNAASGTPVDPQSGSNTTPTGSGTQTGSDAIEMLPDEMGEPKPRVPNVPKPEKPNPEALYKSGLQSFVHGDTKAALASFKRAQQANPNYPPAWRGLGMVNERLGDKSAAKAAFQRYLLLAPTAGDAEQIKARMDQL